MQSLSSNAFPLQKDSELRGVVNYQLNKMKETGIEEDILVSLSVMYVHSGRFIKKNLIFIHIIEDVEIISQYRPS